MSMTRVCFSFCLFHSFLIFYLVFFLSQTKSPRVVCCTSIYVNHIMRVRNQKSLVWWGVAEGFSFISSECLFRFFYFFFVFLFVPSHRSYNVGLEAVEKGGWALVRERKQSKLHHMRPACTSCSVFLEAGQQSFSPGSFL